MDKNTMLLERIARAADRTNLLLGRLLLALDEDSIHCPACGSTEVENTSTMSSPRLTCRCGTCWVPEPEEVSA